MSLQLKPLHPLFVAEASGVDITQPLDAATVRAIDAAMDEHAILVWRDQPLSQEQQIAFASSFGTLDPGLKRLRRAKERYAHEAMIDISNVGVDGQVVNRDNGKIFSNLANQLWHSDSSFQKPAAKYSLLHSVVNPPWGGETEFADLRAAWDALPERSKRQVEGLFSEHYALHSRIMLGDDSYSEEQKRLIPPVQWPLVRTHAGSGRKLLWVGVHATKIFGMSLPEGRVLLGDLLEHATQRQFVYRHEWQVGDTVMWDNRATLHRGRPYDITQRRELRRTTTEDPDSLNEAVPQAA
ncbi:MAG: TauD/TfdA family dioxygenase [Betaproteobacteria bacterium]|nr:TauD/TfdA family dioxygenase [Betaproteobacteria bacterium]